MKRINPWFVLMLMLVSLPFSACSPKPVSGEKIQPAQLEALDDGTDRKRVLLTERAAQRIDLQTAPIDTAQVNGVERKIIPYAAVIYDTTGNTWVYTNPEALTYIREAVVIDFIDGDQAILSEGLDSAQSVVTIGVAELFGAETGVSK